MERDDYSLIIKIIGQTIGFLNRGQYLDNDDIDDIKNQTLLKLTPQLKKILHFEKLHLENFIRKTTRSVFWDYLKSTSTDLTGYRIKKRIRTLLQNSGLADSPFKRPRNDSPWYTGADRGDNDIPGLEKRIRLENIVREWETNAPARDKPVTAAENLGDLVSTILKQVDFGVSIDDIFSALSPFVDSEEMNRVPMEMESGDGVTGLIPGAEVPGGDFTVEERVYFENYAEEFLRNHVNSQQTQIYYLRVVADLEYKEIEKKYGLNIKTAESRLSIKPDKKGFLWRLVEFIRKLELNLEETKKFLEVLHRKIGESCGNIRYEV